LTRGACAQGVAVWGSQCAPEFLDPTPTPLLGLHLGLCRIHEIVKQPPMPEALLVRPCCPQSAQPCGVLAGAEQGVVIGVGVYARHGASIRQELADWMGCNGRNALPSNGSPRRVHLWVGERLRAAGPG